MMIRNWLVHLGVAATFALLGWGAGSVVFGAATGFGFYLGKEHTEGYAELKANRRITITQWKNHLGGLAGPILVLFVAILLG